MVDRLSAERWCVNDRGSNLVLTVDLSSEIDNEIYSSHCNQSCCRGSSSEQSALTLAEHAHRSSLSCECLRLNWELTFERLSCPAPHDVTASMSVSNPFWEWNLCFLLWVRSGNNLRSLFLQMESSQFWSKLFHFWKNLPSILSCSLLKQTHHSWGDSLFNKFKCIPPKSHWWQWRFQGLCNCFEEMPSPLLHTVGNWKCAYAFGHFLNPSWKGIVFRSEQDKLRDLVDGLVRVSKTIDDHFNPPNYAQHEMMKEHTESKPALLVSKQNSFIEIETKNYLPLPWLLCLQRVLMVNNLLLTSSVINWTFFK